jgi:hypothetical protein
MADCIRPSCVRPAKVRGLCNTCYTAARGLIKSGATTWEKLEESDRCLPAGTSGRAKGQGKVQQWLLGAEDKAE